MADEATTTDAPSVDEVAPTTAVDATDSPDGAEALGNAGKKALDAMKAERNSARRELAAAREALEAAKAEAEGRSAEFEADRKARADADARFNERILRAEIKAEAKGKLSDPDDAFKFLNLSEFDVSGDGDVDSTSIADAISSLIASKPYLAVQDGPRFGGSADAGPRNADAPTQLTEGDLARMTPAQINEARRAGRLNRLLGVK